MEGGVEGWRDEWSMERQRDAGKEEARMVAKHAQLGHHSFVSSIKSVPSELSCRKAHRRQPAMVTSPFP